MALDTYQDIAERLKKFMENGVDTVAVSNTTATSNLDTGSITLESIAAAMRDIDPDGRRLREMRLLTAASRLPKEMVEQLIRLAHMMADKSLTTYDHQH